MPIDRALAARQGQVQSAVAGPGGMLERISPDRDPAAMAAERTRQTRPLYDAADLADIPPGALDNIVAAVDDAIRRVGAGSDIGGQLAEGGRQPALGALHERLRKRVELSSVEVVGERPE